MMINDLQQFTQTEMQVIDDRTNAAIKESLVQHMVARLWSNQSESSYLINQIYIYKHSDLFSIL